MVHILVVDDEESARFVIKDILEDYGYKVTVASNGQEGLEYFNNGNNFKLVITDIMMPKMDGIELTRYIRNSDKPNTPIIGITAYIGNKDIDENLFNSIVSKPFNMTSLAKIISKHLES